MEQLAANAKFHLSSYQETLKGRNVTIKSPPGIPPGIKWVHGSSETAIMKLTLEAASTYMEQLEQYVFYLHTAIENRKDEIAAVGRSLDAVDQVITDLKKRKEPEPEPTEPVISVVEVPVMKKPAPPVMRR